MIIYTTRYGQRITEKASYNNDAQERDGIIRYVKKAIKNGAIVKKNMWKSPYHRRWACSFYIFPTEEDYQRECDWYKRMGIRADWDRKEAE